MFTVFERCVYEHKRRVYAVFALVGPICVYAHANARSHGAMDVYFYGCVFLWECISMGVYFYGCVFLWMCISMDVYFYESIFL